MYGKIIICCLLFTFSSCSSRKEKYLESRVKYLQSQIETQTIEYKDTINRLKFQRDEWKNKYQVCEDEKLRLKQEFKEQLDKSKTSLYKYCLEIQRKYLLTLIVKCTGAMLTADSADRYALKQISPILVAMVKIDRPAIVVKKNKLKELITNIENMKRFCDDRKLFYSMNLCNELISFWQLVSKYSY